MNKSILTVFNGVGASNTKTIVGGYCCGVTYMRNRRPNVIAFVNQRAAKIVNAFNTISLEANCNGKFASSIHSPHLLGFIVPTPHWHSFGRRRINGELISYFTGLKIVLLLSKGTFLKVKYLGSNMLKVRVGLAAIAELARSG